MYKIFSSCLLFLLISHSFAQNFPRLNQLVDSLAAHDKFMGNILVMQEGKPLFEKSVGYGNITSKTKLSEDSKFRIASISKMFTAVIYFKTVESGKLHASQRLSEFFPSISKADSIIIDNLLNHRSGIYNYTDEDFLEYKSNPQSPEFLLNKIIEGGSEFSPGSDSWYSNSNYLLLTFILEKVNGAPLDQLIKKWITDPLEMKNTFLPESSDHPEVNSYSYYNDWQLVEPADPSVLLGAGAIISTTEDLAKFAEGLFKGKLINKESLSNMLTIESAFGRGISSFPFDEHAGYGHMGGIDGFQSLLSYFPTEDLTICLLSNGMNYNYGNISEAIVSAYFGHEIEIPNLKNIVLSEQELKKYIGEYSSDDTPLEFTFSVEDGLLIAFPSGYEKAALSPKSLDTFEYTPVNAVLIFNPEKGEMQLNQGGDSYLFRKK
ncbi:serine hydrolase domain-containing protein [Algoriphagus sp. D3-2-R+10]|uniref:serine hydrolase domain-containing protein n=1 Tax=Algoriphagus aurantiacus TaxID=3103948 RepID=UPI002B3C4A19|nr:serine hydrolase domain-containing protein [Algoriphagus sp. D3-2-R+10]MEB2778234.1 serine hydrolase domain-containing protein [Algoriphagus sp. D3-2-R+10]